MPSESLKTWIRNAALAAAIALPLAAAAQQAIVSGGGNLRAGPDTSYPLVAELAPGTPATVMGCTSGYGWCDVVVPGDLRGWLHSSRLDYVYQGVSVPMLNIGAAIGVPIISFTLGTYWNNYYRDRPWYGQPHWWGGRRPPPPVQGWRPAPPSQPSWQPRPPPTHWRPPQQRPDMAPPMHRPPAERPQMQMPERRPPIERPQIQMTERRPPVERPQMQMPDRRPPVERPQMQMPAARPQMQAPERRSSPPPDRRDDHGRHRFDRGG